MSKIQEALKRLQKSGSPVDSPPKTLRNQVRIEQSRSDSVPRAKTPVLPGAVHHVELDELAARGLIAPPAHVQLVADEFRRIKRPLIKNAFAKPDTSFDHANVLMVTSGLPKSGKTFCAVNLGISIAMERELNVLLVDADVAKPQVSRAFGLDDTRGLIDLLMEDGSDVESALIRTDLHDIHVLPAGRAHPQATELLASSRMSEVIDDLAKRFPDRLIIIDSPPLLMTSEAQAIASQVGQIVLVVEYGKTSHETVHEALELLDTSKAINAIVNKSQHWSHGGYYGSGYGYFDDEGNKREED